MYTDVVVGIDGTDAGRDALAVAHTLAPSVVHLALAHVRVLEAPALRGGDPSSEAQTREDSIQLLSAERRRAAAAAAAAETLSVLAPDVGSGLHDVAESRGADLLVIGGCHRSAIGRVLAGDDTRAVLQRAPCAVAVAPRGYRLRAKPLEIIGVADDDSAQSQVALAHARALSRETGARVVARRCVGIGTSGEELTAFSGTVDLLICGSRRHGIVRRVALGATSDYLSRHCACPLIITTAAVRDTGSSLTPGRLATA